MSGREQNNDSYKIGKGFQMKDRNKFNLNNDNLKDSNDPEGQGIPWKREVKEDNLGNTVEIGKKEAINIFSDANEMDNLLRQGNTNNKKCPHCGKELPNEQ